MPNYDINYDDERFTQVNEEKDAALSDLEKTYGDMVGGADEYYDKLIQNAEDWKNQQTNIQNQQTDLTIEQINQQKDKAHKDYIKEQSGAYADWRKQSNEYGTEAEKMASAGLTNTGYSESSQVSMYNTYQNRVMTARESYNQAVIAYDNSIKEAQLQNSSVLAEIAYQTLQQQLELSLQGFQYKNNLLLEQANKKLEIDNMYYNRWQDVLNQMNTENAMAEEIRQYEQNFAFQKEQYQESIRQFNQSYDLQRMEYEEGIRQFNEEIARLKANDEKEHALEIQKLELQKQQLEEEKRQFDEQMALQKSKVYSSSSTGGKTGSTAKDNDSKGDDPKIDKPTGQLTFNGVKVNMTDLAKLGYGSADSTKIASLIKQGKIRLALEGNVYRVYETTAWKNIKNIIPGMSGKHSAAFVEQVNK
jgi:hypothetical protein